MHEMIRRLSPDQLWALMVLLSPETKVFEPMPSLQGQQSQHPASKDRSR